MRVHERPFIIKARINAEMVCETFIHLNPLAINCYLANKLLYG